MNGFQPINNMSELLLIIKKELGIEAFSKNKSKELHSIAYMLDYAPQLKSEINLLKIAINADVFYDFFPATNNENVNTQKVKFRLQERYFLNEKSVNSIIKWYSQVFDIISDDNIENIVAPKISPPKEKNQDDSISFFDKLLQVYHNSDYEFLKKNYKEILRLAGQNDSDALYFAGLCYQNGLGVPKNNQIARQLYEKSVQKENPAAMNTLGSIFEEQKNYKMAEKYYQMAGEYGYAMSIRNICLLKLRIFGSLKSELDYFSIDKYAFTGMTITEENKYQPKQDCLLVNYICSYLGANNASSFVNFIFLHSQSFVSNNMYLVNRYTEKEKNYSESLKATERLFSEKIGYRITTIESVANDCSFIGDYYKKTSDSQSKAVPVYEEKKEYSSGVYSGYTLNGKRHGKGIYSLKNGDIYEGDFLEDLFHGQGKYTKKDGSIYEGEFCKGKMQGNGKLITKEGDSFEGFFSDDRFSGNGYINYRFSDGRYYQGKVIENKITGFGEMTFPNAGKYTGEFMNGRFHGKGELLFGDGTIFKGEFINGEIAGSGIIIKKKGKTIQGNNAVWLAEKLRKLYEI